MNSTPFQNTFLEVQKWFFLGLHWYSYGLWNLLKLQANNFSAKCVILNVLKFLFIFGLFFIFFYFQSMDSCRQSRSWNAKENVHSSRFPGHGGTMDAKSCLISQIEADKQHLRQTRPCEFIYLLYSAQLLIYYCSSRVPNFFFICQKYVEPEGMPKPPSDPIGTQKGTLD